MEPSEPLLVEPPAGVGPLAEPLPMEPPTGVDEPPAGVGAAPEPLLAEPPTGVDGSPAAVGPPHPHLYGAEANCCCYSSHCCCQSACIGLSNLLSFLFAGPSTICYSSLCLFLRLRRQHLLQSFLPPSIGIQKAFSFVLFSFPKFVPLHVFSFVAAFVH